MQRPFIASALLLQLAACSTWQPIQQPIPEHLASQPEPTVRVTLANGLRLELDAPRATVDSVVGFTTGGMRARKAIALDQVTLVEYSRSDPGKTVGAALIGVAAVAVVVGSIATVRSVSDLANW